MNKKSLLKLTLASCAASLLTGCASTKVSSQSQYEGFLARPNQVYVYNFAVSPDEVKLGTGIGSDIEEWARKTPRTDQERAIGRQVSEALAKHLITEIQKLGLNAVRAGDAPSESGNNLAVQGQFISIDEGNRTERVVIGLGLGRSDVRTKVQVYDFANGKKTVADQFEVDAKSGRKPGAAETMGVGAAAGHLATSAAVSGGLAVGSEEFSANVDADADRTAKSIAKQLKTFFVPRDGFSREMSRNTAGATNNRKENDTEIPENRGTGGDPIAVGRRARVHFLFLHAPIVQHRPGHD